MKLLKSLILLLTIYIGLSLCKSCNNDKECGKNQICAHLAFEHGNGYDPKKNEAVVLGNYFDSNNNQVGAPAMFGIPLDSSNANAIHKRFELHGETTNGPNQTSYQQLYTYLPKNDRYYIMTVHTSSPIFSIYNQRSQTWEYIWNIFNTPFQPSFDEVDNRFVFGARGIYFLNRLPTKKSDFEDSVLLYENQIVNGITFDGFDIYMTTYDGKILKGNTGCVNCTQDKLELVANDPDVKSRTVGLIMDKDYLYYANENGIKKVPKSGDLSKSKYIVTDNNIVSLTFNLNFDTIIFSGAGGQVKTISTKDSAKSKLIYDPTPNKQCLNK